MSSARRTQEDLRRILGYQDTQGGLQPPNERLRIDAGRGVFVIGTGETQSGSGSGATDEDDNPVTPVTPPEGDGNQNGDGTGDGDGNTDPDATDPDDFVEDPEDSNWDVGDDTYGGDWGSGGPISFVDCVDNTCIEIVPRGGYVPPEGWDSPDTPPPDPSYAQGSYWNGGSGNNKSLTASGSCALIRPDGFTSAEKVSDTHYRCRGINTVYANVYLFSCSDSFDASLCGSNIQPPSLSEFWPEDDCIQLAPNADGQWAASDRENPNDLTSKYSSPKSVLDLCTPSGDGVQILPGADGGSVYWNYSQGTYMAISPDGKRSFGGSSGLKGKVAGSAQDGGNGPKPVGAPTPS